MFVFAVFGCKTVLYFNLAKLLLCCCNLKPGECARKRRDVGGKEDMSKIENKKKVYSYKHIYLE
ncbi:MAG: hypothetical protein ACI8RD_000649 [Bacillariaceae sp.]|jgi:hypothetical protein